ncbi:unnamed protein product [Arabis nemorensis]|uniref:Reverse transcriptase zinc-binding domain-containing protein n=1 Tax=Arabis nemorensis TaxID=586526 RepID=A0A565BMK6_9BRAS|nr:unnamed protein product [Arabis nemorensis]
MKKQMGWIIGNGESINIWPDPWLSYTEQTRPMGPQPEAAQNITVADLLRQDTKEWDIEKVEQYLPFHKVQILSLKPSILGAPDKFKWLKHPSGDR